MARNIWPLLQNRNEEEWTLVHSDEWRFPLGRVDFCNSAGACLSVSQSVCPRTFVNSGRTDGPIWTRQTPKDAPKRRNDDGVCHVAPRATWHVPRAAAWTLRKNTLAGVQPKRKESESPNFQDRCTPVWDVCHVSDDSIGSKLCPQGTISFFSLIPSSSETLWPIDTKLTPFDAV